MRSAARVLDCLLMREAADHKSAALTPPKDKTLHDRPTQKTSSVLLQWLLFWALLGAVTALVISRHDTHTCQKRLSQQTTPAANTTSGTNPPNSNILSESSPNLREEPKLSPKQKRSQCKRTCRLEIVESIPENVTFGHDALIPTSTFEAWLQLINNAKSEILIAAYKSSLRGKHVLHAHNTHHSQPGEVVFDELLQAGNHRNVSIRMVENFPPKDVGDNADGKSLQRKGAVERRTLHFSKLFGAGTMHSKFLVVDRRHLYLGSANLDWRSLNQKMELGVLLWDCPCFARDLTRIFSSYWNLTTVDTDTEQQTPDWRAHADNVLVGTAYNAHNPLHITHNGEPTQMFLAASPQELNGAGRTWDLDAVLEMIDNAQDYIYIHVMDYIPMVVYREPKRYWPVIDDAIRRAVIERGVEVKLLSAALHFAPQTLRFLKSLAALNSVFEKGSLQVKIFKVPTDEDAQNVLARERRTHNKFMVTETASIIGDYFMGNTGVALVVQQTEAKKRLLIEQMRNIFLRDWHSSYAHTLTTYMKLCLYNEQSQQEAICEVEKDSSMLHNPLN